MSENNLQLDFIAAISNDPNIGSKASSNVQSALEILSTLLGSEQIILSNIYFDINNQEIQTKSHFFTAHNKNALMQSFVNKFCVNTPANILLKIQEQRHEIEVDHALLFLNLTSESQPGLDGANTTMPFYVVPFKTGDQIIGTLAYQAERSIDFQVNFTASYNVLKSIFMNAYQLKQAFIEKYTFQTVLDLMPQRVFWKNRDSVYMGCNKAFAQDASLAEPHDILGLNDYDVFPEQADLYRSDDANTMNTREHLISSEEPQTQKNGNTIWLRTSKRPIINNENTVVGIVGTYDDISELKNTQQELSLAKVDLEQRVQERTLELTTTNEKLEVVITELKSTQDHLVETEKMAALGTLVAGVSHEINTPLGIAVTGASHLESLSESLKAKVLSGGISKTEFISNCDAIMNSSDLILRNLERASELIRNFKMIAVDQSNDEKRPIIFKKYLHDIINAMTPQTKQKNIKFFVTGDEGVVISTYPGTIAQIFTNLIANTILHGFTEQDSGEIHISYGLVDGILSMMFEDNGSGISTDKLGKIFQPFYTTNRAQGGSGLGLSIVFNLVTQRLNGKIVCESRVDEWTQFNISFPVE